MYINHKLILPIIICVCHFPSLPKNFKSVYLLFRTILTPVCCPYHIPVQGVKLIHLLATNPKSNKSEALPGHKKILFFPREKSSQSATRQ